MVAGSRLEGYWGKPWWSLYIAHIILQERRSSELESACFHFLNLIRKCASHNSTWWLTAKLGDWLLEPHRPAEAFQRRCRFHFRFSTIGASIIQPGIALKTSIASITYELSGESRDWHIEKIPKSLIKRFLCLVCCPPNCVFQSVLFRQTFLLRGAYPVFPLLCMNIVLEE